MLNHLVTVVDLPHLLLPEPTPTPIAPEPTQPELPRDGQRFLCPITGIATVVSGLIVEREVSQTHESYWWGCWSCAGLYWSPGTPLTTLPQKSWHVVRVTVTPQPTDADRLAQLLTEFVAMRDVAEAALADLPPDPDYHAYVDDLLTHCREIVAAMRDRAGARLPNLITIHP
jgi:hypothetical protein